MTDQNVAPAHIAGFTGKRVRQLLGVTVIAAVASVGVTLGVVYAFSEEEASAIAYNLQLGAPGAVFAGQAMGVTVIASALCLMASIWKPLHGLVGTALCALASLGLLSWASTVNVAAWDVTPLQALFSRLCLATMLVAVAAARWALHTRSEATTSTARHKPVAWSSVAVAACSLALGCVGASVGNQSHFDATPPPGSTSVAAP